MAAGKPDFLCIGAQKAGTTWLHENLIQHPGVWLPPVKELHVLDHAPPPLFKRLFGKASHHRLAREHLREVVVGCKAEAGARSLAWHIAFGKRDRAWYNKLFIYADGRAAGEICPGYARLDEPVIADLAARYPHLKIIYLLRDPVDRAWSSVAMHFRKGGAGLVTGQDSKSIMAQLRKPKSFAHCTYRRNIEAWSRHFPQEQMYFGFFERIRREPDAYLGEILDFLGVPGNFSPRNASEPVNQGKGEKIETGLERDIAALLLPEAQYLHQRFANAYTSRWLEHAQQLAERRGAASVAAG
jgi:hypothetical protein